MGLKLTIKDTTGRSVVVSPDSTSIRDQEITHTISQGEFDQIIKSKPSYTKLQQADLKVSLLKQVNAEPELSILALADWHEEFYEGSDREEIVYGLRQLEKWKRMPVERTVRFQNPFGDHNTWIWEPIPPLAMLAKASHYLPPACFERMIAEESWYENKPMPKSEAIMLAALAIGNTRETLHVKPTLAEGLTPVNVLSTFGLSSEQMNYFFRRFSVNPRDHYQGQSPLQNPDVDEGEDQHDYDTYG